MRGWVKASIGLAVFGFITITLFSVLSDPFVYLADPDEGIISEQAQELGVDSDVTPFLTMIMTVFGFTFLSSVIGLVLWFFMGSHEEEQDYYQGGRRY